MSDKSEYVEPLSVDYDSKIEYSLVSDELNDEYICSHGVPGCECEETDCESEDGFETD